MSGSKHLRRTSCIRRGENQEIETLISEEALLFANLQAIGSATLIRGPLKMLSVILGTIGLIALELHFA